MFAKIFHVWFTAKTLVEIEKIGFQNEPALFFCECQNRSTGSSTGRLVLCIFVVFFNSSFRPVDRFVSRSTDLVHVWFSCEIVTLISLDLLRVLACDFGDF